MMVAGLDGTISSINPAWTQLLGWKEAELLGANVLDFVVPDERDRLQSELRRPVARHRAQADRARHAHQAGGASRRIEWSAVAADDLLQAVGRDVTAEREAEEALRKAEDALRHSQKMEAIGQLTGGIAHDFNNMLTAIIGSMEVLKRRIRAGRYDDVQTLHGRRHRRRQSRGGADAPAARLRPAPAARSQGGRRQSADPRHGGVAAADPGRGDQACGRPCRRALAGADGCPPARECDPQSGDQRARRDARGRHAVDRHDPRDPRRADSVSARRRSRPATTSWSASATPASACPHETLKKVFEPFFTTKPIGQGTGLGLSMIYGFAKQSRGHVRIESAEGRGTTFRLYLPLYQGSVEARAVAPAREVATGAGETVLVDRRRFRGAPDHLRRAARAGLCLHRGQRRPGGAAHADLQHAPRPADHRRRSARPERTADRRDRAPAPAGPQDPVRHRLCRARDGPRARSSSRAWRW